MYPCAERYEISGYYIIILSISMWNHQLAVTCSLSCCGEPLFSQHFERLRVPPAVPLPAKFLIMALVAAEHVDPREGTLEGLAEKWESCFETRKKFRRIGALVEWPSADLAGIPSMILTCKKLWGS